MNRPLRARYGARDNMHALLEWEGHSARLPVDLLGLTDKPPGSHAPGDRWWPSVGCGPLEGWWALWWTVPDQQARRGGMVRSEVALWRLEEVGAVNDLRSVMESLSGQASIPVPSIDMIGAVAEALLAPNPGRPVLRDLDLWPGVIAALWARLWPEARRAFSARVAVSPPQGGESVTPPWLFGVPSDRALQWSGHRVIPAAPGLTQLTRAARWLVGESDPTFNEVLNASPSLPAELGTLRTVARAADRLELMREGPDPQRALDLLRTLLVLAPTAETAGSLKREGLSVLERGLAEAPASLVLFLANFKLADVPSGGILESELKAWVSRRAPELPIEDVSKLLEMLSPGKAESWWQEAILTSFSAGLANAEGSWTKAALHWLGLSRPADVLLAILPTTEEIEQRLLDATSGVELTEAALPQLRRQAIERKWSRLHAWAVMQSMSPQEALRAQRTFPGDPFAGLALLAERLPGTTVVEETISRPDTTLISLVARRTAREPDLLGAMDVSHAVWRTLWAAHVKAGGAHWPPGVSRDALGRGILNAILAGDEPDGLVASLAEGLAGVALDHPKRPALWSALSTSGRAALLLHVAEALAKRCNAGEPVTPPERELGEAVLLRARQRSPSARLLVELLRWNAGVNEQEAIQWLDGPSGPEWEPVADALGRAVLAKGWRLAAKAIYDRRLRSSGLQIAAEICQELLPKWEQFLLSFNEKFKKRGHSNDAPLINRVAELGARLASDRLGDLWERAGGERQRLRDGGTPDVQWREAATLAHKGALKGGLGALVRELLADFPHNLDLNELGTLFGRNGH